MWLEIDKVDNPRYVLRWDLKVSMESRVRMCSGSEFQSLGAEQLKARAPSEVSENEGVESRAADEERSERGGI